MFMGMDQQFVILEMPIPPTEGTVGLPIPMWNMDIFRRLMISYSLFELNPCYFKLLFPLRAPINGVQLYQYFINK